MPDAPPDFVAAARRVIAHRLTRVAVCWLACLGLAAGRWLHARHCFDTPVRPDMSAADLDRVREDGNNGHIWIDFGAQWVFGRTAAEGRWRDLYHRDGLRRTAEAGYPLHRQSPAQQKWSSAPNLRPPDLQLDEVRADADRLLRAMMGDGVEDRRNEKLSWAVGGGPAAPGDNPFAAAAFQAEADEVVRQDLAGETPLLGRPVLGGPLYPPVHAIFYSPLGLIDDPQRAYFLFQLFSVVCVFGCGLAVRVLTRGRVWWSVATALLLLFPGMRAGLDLGQNNALTLLIVLSGWAVAARYSRFGGGLIWGLLAFKPVWGVAFILAPVLLRQWRFVLGVGVSGVALCLATLPLVGVEGWREWMHIGGEAAALYNTDTNWINLSRDVSGLPKRFYMDFTQPQPKGGEPWINAVCNALLAGVGVATVAVGVLGGGTWKRLGRVAARRPTLLGPYLARGYGLRFTGLRAGFILLGSYLCCYRFMYYDAVLAGVGFAALLAHPKWTLAGWRGELREALQPAARRRAFLFVSSAPLSLLALLILTENVFLNSGGAVTLANDLVLVRVSDPCSATQTVRQTDGGTGTEPKPKWQPRQVSLKLDYNHALDTYLVLVTWAWCGWRLLRDGRHADRASSRDPPHDPPGG